jgi:hypothetical protein
MTSNQESVDVEDVARKLVDSNPSPQQPTTPSHIDSNINPGNISGMKYKRG